MQRPPTRPYPPQQRDFEVRTEEQPQIGPEWGGFKPRDMPQINNWGQQKDVVFRHALFNGDSESTSTPILEGSLLQKQTVKEPILRSFYCSVFPNCPQENPLVNNELPDVSIVGRLKFGVGGTTQTIYFSWKQGTVITVACMSWDLAAWIEPSQGINTVGPAPALFDYPSDGKTVRLSAMMSTMPRTGSSIIVPSRDITQIYVPPLGPPIVHTYFVPPYTQSVRFLATDPTPALVAVFRGVAGTALYTVPVVALDTIYHIPAGCFSIDVTYTGAFAFDSVTASFLLGLLHAKESTQCPTWFRHYSNTWKTGEQLSLTNGFRLRLPIHPSNPRPVFIRASRKSE